jgi:hypothetical protein
VSLELAGHFAGMDADPAALLDSEIGELASSDRS